MLKWISEEDGTVGQFGFRPTPPLFVPGGRFDINFVPAYPIAQATRFQTPVATAPGMPPKYQFHLRRGHKYRIRFTFPCSSNVPVPLAVLGGQWADISYKTERTPTGCRLRVNAMWHGSDAVVSDPAGSLGLRPLPVEEFVDETTGQNLFPSTYRRSLLGLGQITTVGLIGGHIYRARWLVTNPIPLLGCDALPLAPIIQNILNIPGTGPTFPADLLVLTIPSADWEADRRDVPHAANECVVYAQMRAISDQLLPIGSMQQALQPVGGRLVDFWDATFGITLIDNRTSDSPAPTPPPSIPPVISPPPGPTPPEPPPPTGSPTTPTTPRPPVTTKPKKTTSEVVIPWGIGIALVSLAIKLIRK
jgi:hypothetical protein